MQYYKFVFEIDCDENIKDLFVYDLGELGFESFESLAHSLIGYMPQENFVSKEEVETLCGEYEGVKLTDFELLPFVNWNRQWEESYQAVEIGDYCRIRAPFHSLDEKFNYDILIEPKMSFGTAHHPTTYLMLEYIYANKAFFKDAFVVDMGCGTGVLAIFAAKMGAGKVFLVDYDQNAVENARENLELNKISSFELRIGSCEVLQTLDTEADAILANINRNILLDHLPNYHAKLKKGGLLFLSGFYTSDFAQMDSLAKKLGFSLVEKREKEDWLALTYKK